MEIMNALLLVRVLNMLILDLTSRKHQRISINAVQREARGISLGKRDSEPERGEMEIWDHGCYGAGLIS